MKTIHHYKSFLSAIISVALFYSTAPHADILDGGEIQFNGFVTDDAPKWTWQISSPDQTWAVDTADARTDNGQLVFNLRDKGVLPFLEGHLYEVAERGGPGFTPFITFSSNGQPFTVTEGNGTSAQHFRASVPVRDPETGNVSGQLSFTLNQGMAVSAGRQEFGASVLTGMSLVSGQSVTDVQSGTLPQGLKARLSSLLLMNQNFGNGMNAVDNGQVIHQGILADGRVMNLAAAYASAVSDFELRLSAEGTPAAWQAGLNVTVTVQ
ncbi:F4 (K88) fimbria minor subunit FaeH [Salmonella enterica]|uniref:Fimbrial protein n=2 Tax=Salmonella enterica TaxID=28901 RepID=A0A5T7VSK1_SALER|nr:fimbrial protein [Salmonella enterica]EAC2151815.1 fimbrial protein [Salmonella enterica subsp. enterica]EBL4292008.1 fimbrial protein [Salmonella enterica subsp. enterica serovar Rubislaw]EBS4388784.1 fimbrial protein [Salmonella enterica subsp. enterica serovar Panama]EBS5590112.1 fimbrial protein [Salmonella enterica subsp. enterica serovar Newport]ECI0430303.1 fimbrial protein [Salmonella enterica subsp. enterica serovar Soumbedioune]ECS6612854.1 fimbrial protein [Salmonella enterica s